MALWLRDICAVVDTVWIEVLRRWVNTGVGTVHCKVRDGASGNNSHPPAVDTVRRRSRDAVGRRQPARGRQPRRDRRRYRDGVQQRQLGRLRRR